MMIKRLMPLLFAVVLGTGAVVLVWLDRQALIRNLQAERAKLLADYREPTQVIVAKRDLKEGHTVAKEDLALATVPGQFVQPYATATASELIGRVTVAPMAEGEQLLLNKLRRPEEMPAGARLADVTPEQKRAVTIGLDALTGVGGFVRPGDTVDVLWTLQLPKEQGGGTVTLVLFQHVDVLAVGDQMLGKLAPAQQDASRAYTVTLALTPEQTSLLLYAREQGRVQVSLRPKTDKGQLASVGPVNHLTVLQSVLGLEVPVEPPKPPRVVEVFKGLELNLVNVTE